MTVASTSARFRVAGILVVFGLSTGSVAAATGAADRPRSPAPPVGCDTSTGTDKWFDGTYVVGDRTIAVWRAGAHGAVISDFPSGRQGRLLRTGPDSFAIARFPTDTPYVDSPKLRIWCDARGTARLGIQDIGLHKQDGARIALREEEVRFANDSVSLAGTLVEPAGPGPFPAVVFVHGSGAATRASFGGWAPLFARYGVAALTFDKRGTGASSGNFETSTLDDLAGDVAAAVRLLSQRPEIRANRVGLVGTSQGGWIAPKAAARVPVAFIVFSSGGAVSGGEQEVYRRIGSVEKAGYTVAAIDTARTLLQQYFAYLGTNGTQGVDAMSGAWNAYHAAPWYPILDMPKSDPTKNAWPATRKAFARDIALDEDSFRTLEMPMLVLLGAEDETLPTAAVTAGFKRLLPAKGMANLKIEVFPGGGHGTMMPAEPGKMAQFAPGYFATMLNWVAHATRNTQSGRKEE